MVNELYILDSNFNTLTFIDEYISLIWNERYNEAGDFELILPKSSPVIPYMAMNNYLWSADSDKLMIIENYKTQSDILSGDEILYSGRSLESILDRRIVWQQTTVSGKVQDVIRKLLNDSIIFQKKNGNVWIDEYETSDRRIENFRFEPNSDAKLAEITMPEAQFTGDNIYEVINTITKLYKVGYEIYLNPTTREWIDEETGEHYQYTANQFIFKLYLGVDRSSKQTTVPQIEFSENNENLLSSLTTILGDTYRNVALIAGEGEGLSRRTKTYGTETGLTRRELFVDARDISSNDGAISNDSYLKLLEERGKEKLKDYEVKKETDTDVDTNNQLYELGVDYMLGDVVENVDSFGIRSRSRITEITTSITPSEISMHPIFSVEEIVNETDKETT